MDELTISTEKQTNNSSLIDSCFECINQKLPVVSRTLSESGSSTVDEYTNKSLISSTESYQGKSDLVEVIIKYVTPLLGISIANRVAETLIKKPTVLTANHHGVDYFAQSVQGSLLFGLSSESGYATQGDSTQDYAIPVFACGNIPLNNLTYPRGALIYPEISENNVSFPVKIPLFPDRLKRTTVSKSPALNEQMIQRMQNRIVKIQSASNNNCYKLLQTLLEILEQEYNQEAVLSLNCYSDQSVILNQRLWQRMFAKDVSAPPLVYLELEKIASLLLEYDLKNTASLASLLLFNPKALTRLHSELKSIKGSGTFLFWGIDKVGCRVSLFYDESLNSLTGVSERGDTFTISIEPTEIYQSIQEGRLLPSLFTSFLVIAFARGVTCAGGYYQAEYLPQMQQAVVNALRSDPECTATADMVETVNTKAYLSGMQAVMSQYQNTLVPSGPVEIIAAGGLTRSDIERLRCITVKQAHTASILDTVADVMPHYMTEAGYFKTRRKLAEETSVLLQDSNLIIKQLI